MKNFTYAVLATTTILAIPSIPTSAAPLAAIEQQQTQTSSIDLTADDADITAIGIGRPDQRGAAMSRLAATMDAQRNLLGIIKGVQIDADTLMQDLLITSDEVKRNISGLLKGAKVIDEGTYADGSYWVKMSAPLYGAEDSLAAAVLPEVMGDTQEPFPEVDEASVDTDGQNLDYSGVVIDADGMGLNPTFSPVIYDTNGRAVYGAKNIDPDVAINKGMVGYADNVFDANKNKRVGDNPLTVKAVSVTGGTSPNSTVNVVVSVEDANRILMVNQHTNILADCSVVFVK